MHNSSSRLAALVAGLALVGTSALTVAPAQARTSSKTYKAGAVALGALGAYLLSKGKTVEGAAVLGGGVLAYKKGRDVQREEQRYGRYDSSPRYGYNDNYGNAYPGSDYRYDGQRDNTDRWNSGWRGNAQFRPQPGNNGHHYGQYKHHRHHKDGCDRDDD